MALLPKRLGQFIRAQSTVFHWFGARALRPYGYYVPYRYAAEVRPPTERDAISWLAAHMAEHAETFLDHLRYAATFNDRLGEFRAEVEGEPDRPRLNQTWFCGLDAALAYAMVRRYRPSRIIEVGSGHSTRFLAQAARDEGLDCTLHSVDPEPRKNIDALCSKVHRCSVTALPLSEFSRLGHRDFLFIDGSHVAMPGSDVDHLITRVLPCLAPGVIVHFHDIFLPHGYPRRWPWRDYNEQYLLAAMLGGGERLEILCPNAYLRRHHRAATEALGARLEPGALESSFWIRIRDEQEPR